MLQNFLERPRDINSGKQFMWHEHPFRPIKNPRLDSDLYSLCGQPVFITIRAYMHLAPFQDPQLCNMAVGTLLEQKEDLKCRIHIYCLMLDHIHFLVSPRQDGNSVLDFTKWYKGKTTHLSWNLGWEGKLWQPRFYDHIVRSDESLGAISDYILQNPIRKGLASSTEEWPWCGIP
jgi:putative transposase